MNSILSAFNFAIIDCNSDILNWLIRMLVACVCGFAIGFERKSRSKEAGIRTHSIVCMASCIIMIVSKYGFSDTGAVDYERIAAQVVSGIGFLGAGIIFYKHDFLHGLTTAAGVWATAGIGLAIGAGMIFVGLIATTMLVLLQILLHRPWKFLKGNMVHVIRLNVKLDEDGVVDKINELFDVKKILQFKTKNEDENRITGVIELVTERDFTANEILEISKNNKFINTIEKIDEL